MPERSRYPWSDADYCLLTDLLADGWTLQSIAARLERSKWSVQAQARKIGIRVRRSLTVAVQLQLDPEAHYWLTQAAGLRNVTPNTLARIVIELAVRDRVWLDKLLDDGGYAERHELKEGGARRCAHQDNKYRRNGPHVPPRSLNFRTNPIMHFFDVLIERM
jgi:hypothetical protein